MKEPIERIILKHSGRGMDVLAPYLPANYCSRAANALLECERGNVFILTGFYVNGAGETDGPPGAFFLARALIRLGFHPIIVTDIYCQAYFDYEDGLETVYVPLPQECTPSFFELLLDKYQPVALISVERCGRNDKSLYCNMRGKDISDHTAQLDNLFLMADDNILKIGVGDGGNEIGMGNLRTIIARELEISPCIIEADHLIVATVSNWGAFGLTAYLQMHSRKSLMPSTQDLMDYLDYLLSCGAVDGVKGTGSRSVDGFDLKTEAEILSALERTIGDHASSGHTMSPNYGLVSLSQRAIGTRMIDLVVDQVRTARISDFSLLDVGCGSGELTGELAKVLASDGVQLYGMDTDLEALENGSGRFPDIRFVKGDMYDPPVEIGAFDLIYSNETLHWMPRMPVEFSNQPHIIYYFFDESNIKAYSEWGLECYKKSLSSIYKLLKPGGLAFLQFGLWNQLIDVYRVIDQALEDFPSSQIKGTALPLFYAHDYQIRRIIESLGFRVIRFSKLLEDLEESTPDEMANFIAGFSFNMFSRSLGKQTAEAFFDHLKDFLELHGIEEVRKNQWNRLVLVLARPR